MWAGRALCSLFITASLNTVAAQPDKDNLESGISAALSIGAEYDSNVSVDELDASSQQSDYALLLGANLEFGAELSTDTEWSVGYEINQTLYDEFSNLDRQTHVLSTSLDSKVGDLGTGISYYYIDSRLDGNEFLTLHRISPELSGFIAREWFVRAAWVYSDKTIEQASARDAETNAGELDLYYFANGLRSYWNAGYRYRDEEAEADRLAYTSHSAKLRYIRRFDWLQRSHRFEIAWRYEDRDYQGVNPRIGEKRQDQRHRLAAKLKTPIGKHAELITYYGYSDYQSNLPNADYDQQVAGIEFIYRI